MFLILREKGIIKTTYFSVVRSTTKMNFDGTHHFQIPISMSNTVKHRFTVPRFTGSLNPPKTCYLCKSVSIVVCYLHWWKISILAPNNSTRLRDESSGPSNEFRQTSRQKQPGKWTHEDYKAAFQLFDKNKDGTITRDELQQVLQTLGQNATKDEMDQFIGDVSFQCYLALL